MATYSRNYGYLKDPDKRLRDERRARDEHFTSEEDALLGTDTDAVIGDRIGKSSRAIHKRRKRLDKAPFRKAGNGRHLAKGYVVVSLHPEDPLHDMTRKGGYVQEHRLVMARHLDRPLTIDESVHHINGVKTDNRIENLELWSRTHPSGQRVTDMLEWCKDFVARYDNEFMGQSCYEPDHF